jgi:hypothetical protein
MNKTLMCCWLGSRQQQPGRSDWILLLAEAEMMLGAATTPSPPVMDAPAPPRPAVVSEDTKTFDRGRRREGKHTHTHTHI